MPCSTCGGSGAIRKFAEQGEVCGTCAGLGSVLVPDPPAPPVTIDDVRKRENEAKDTRMVEPGDLLKRRGRGRR